MPLGAQIQRAMAMAVVLVRGTWQEAVTGEVLPGMPGPIRSEQYAASITSTIHQDGIAGDSFEAEVFTSGRDAGGQPFYPQPTWLEDGKAPWDMKPLLLAGPKAKSGKKGRYATIPFRHGTPGGVGQAGPSMPDDIYAMAKELGEGESVGEEEVGTIGLRSKLPVGGMAAAYTWKSSPYLGMQKMSFEYGKATQGKYLTFRRVSENSDPNSWWHPGFRRYGIAQAVVEKVRPMVIGMLRKAAVADVVALTDDALGISVRRG